MTYVFSFVAGLLTILNPCVLPLVPVVLTGAAASSRLGPLAQVLSLAASFAVSGMVLASLARLPRHRVRRRPPAVRHRPGAAGAESRRPPGRRPRAALGLGRAAAGNVAPGRAGHFATGALLGLAWAPCLCPTLGAAFALAAAGDDAGRRVNGRVRVGRDGFPAAAGSILGLLTARAGGGRRHPRPAGLGRGQVPVALLILTGFDKRLEGTIVGALPDWFVILATRF